MGFHAGHLGLKKLHSHGKDALLVSGIVPGTGRGGLGPASSCRDFLELLRNWGNQPSACNLGKTLWTGQRQEPLGA